MSKNDGGPAFPTTPVNNGYDHTTTGNGTGSGVGMTLRDYFAAKAMASCYAEYFKGLERLEFPCEPQWREGVARDAYSMADAMLATRDTTTFQESL